MLRAWPLLRTHWRTHDRWKKSLAITPGGNAMDTGTGIASCFSETLSACTLFYFPVSVD
jgi:hypothetical protein